MNESVGTHGGGAMSHQGDGGNSLVFEIITAEQYVTASQLLSIISMVVAFSGVITNAINISVFIRMGIEDGVTLTFLFLSISDFSFTLVTFMKNIATLLSTLEGKYNLWFKIDPFAVGFFAANVFWGMYFVTIFTTTYLAVVRCLCVAMPLQFKNIFTRSRSLIILLTFPLIGIGSQIPIYAEMGMTSKFDPKHNASRNVLWMSENRERVKDGVRAVYEPIVNFLCQIIVIVCVIVMAIKLKESARFRRQQEVADKKIDSKLKGKEFSVLLQVFIISAIFVFCNLIKIFNSVFHLHPEFDMGKRLQYLYLMMSLIANLSSAINSSINIYVYLMFNKKFRSVFFKERKEGNLGKKL